MIVLLLTTKNEGDLLRLNLEHHLNGGVDRIAVADNLSNDSTQDVVREFGDAVVSRRFDDFHARQSVRRAMLAELHGDRGVVDWAIIADTDEFFWAEEALPDRLGRARRTAVAVRFDAKLYLPTALDPTEGSVVNSRRYRTSGGDSPLHSSYVAGKTAYRPEWLIGRGPDHSCARHEHLCQDAAPEEVEEGDLRVHHYMIQSEDQFVEKVVRLIEWAKPPSGTVAGIRWRLTPKRRRALPRWSDRFKKEWWAVYQQAGRDGLRTYYRSTYVIPADKVAESLAAGQLVLDDGLARWREARGLR